MIPRQSDATVPETWIDRLGIPVPEDLLMDPDLAEQEAAKIENSSPAALINSQRTKNRSSSSESSLGDQEAAELQEYLRQSSLHCSNSHLGDVRDEDTTVVDGPGSEAWCNVEWARPSSALVTSADGVEDDCTVEEEQALLNDDYLGCSPPAARTGSSAKNVSALRSRRKFDGSQLRRGVVSVCTTAAHSKLPRKRKDDLKECFSLPLQPSNSLSFCPPLHARCAGQKQRMRRRERDRSAKSSEQDYHQNEKGLLSPPCERAPSPPPYSEGTSQPPNFRCESLPHLTRSAKSNHRCRYLSVSSRRLSEPSPIYAPPPSPLPVPPSPSYEAPPLPHECLTQYAHVSSLLRRTNAGGPDAVTSPTGVGRKFSQEELLYQQEASETLWLELQAWHAQLDCYTYDNFLFTQRDKVKNVIENVLNFTMPTKPPSQMSSCQVSCLSIWCSSCRDHQDRALRQVALLMSQIEEVEALFPSTAKMIILYPAWGGAEFTSRCRTLYLWYNTTLHLRQTITLLGNRLQHIAKSVIPWPTFLPCNQVAPSPMSTTQRTFSSEEENSNKDGTVDSSFDQDRQKEDESDVTSSFQLVVDRADSAQQDDATTHVAAPKSRTGVRFEVGDESGEEDDKESDPCSSSEKRGVESKPGEMRGKFEDAGRSDSSSSLLSADDGADGGGLKRSPSSLFLAANPYRKYVEKCMHSKGLHKTFEKIVEVIRDAMARTVCLMEEQHGHAHPYRNDRDRILVNYCSELRRTLHCTDDLLDAATPHDRGVPPSELEVASAPQLFAPEDAHGNQGDATMAGNSLEQLLVPAVTSQAGAGGCSCDVNYGGLGQECPSRALHDNATSSSSHHCVNDQIPSDAATATACQPCSCDNATEDRNTTCSCCKVTSQNAGRCDPPQTSVHSCSCGGCTTATRVKTVQCSWSGRMWLMGLPGLPSLFWFLSSVPVLLVCECLSLRLSQVPKQPSQLSIRQLVRECREGLRLAVTVRRRFLRWSGAMEQHLSSPRKRHDVTGRQRLASVTSVTSSGGGCRGTSIADGGETVRRVSAPTTGGSHLLSTVPEGQSQHLDVPSVTLQTSFSAPTTPMKVRSSGQLPLKACASPPAPFRACATSSASQANVMHPAPQLSPLAPMLAHDSHIFFSGCADQHIGTRRQSGESYDIDLGLCSTERQEPQLSVAYTRGNVFHRPDVFAPPLSTHELRTTNDISLLHQQESPDFGATRVGPISQVAETEEKHVDLNSTDEGVVLTSPESSERSSVTCGTVGSKVGDTGPAVHNLQTLRKELSRRQTSLLQDLDLNIETLLKVYLDWLDMYIPVAGSTTSNQTACSSSSTDHNASGLLHEWQFVCGICPQVLHAYTLAATRFCNLAELLVREAWDTLSSGIDELTALLQSDAFSSSNFIGVSDKSPDAALVSSSAPSPSTHDSPRLSCKRELSRLEVRRLHAVVLGSRRRMGRALALARALKQQLEVAVQYQRHPSASLHRLLHALRTTGHVRLDRVDPRYAVFAPGHLAHDLDSVMVLLSLTPLPDEHRMNASVTEGPLVPSLLLTSPSSQTHPLLVVPPTQSNSTSGVPAAASLVPRNSFSSSDNNKLAYLILLRLDAWMPSHDSSSSSTKPSSQSTFFPANFRSTLPQMATTESTTLPADPSSLDRETTLPTSTTASAVFNAAKKGPPGGAKRYKLPWSGPVVRLQPTAAVTIALSSLQTCDAVAVSSSSSVSTVLSYLSSLLPPSLLVPLHERSVPHAAVSAALDALKVVCLEVCGRLGKCVTVVAQLLRLEAGREETDRRDGLPQASGPLSPATYSSSSSITRDVLQQLYTFGFEYHRDVCRLFSSSSSSEQARVVSHLVSFSQSWMKFCHQHYPQGSGSRPRWSANGLDFLLYTCSPQHLRHVHKRQAQAFLNEVQQCYHHIVGLAKPEPVLPPAPLTPSTARKQFRSSSSSVSTRSTSESPSPRVPMIDARLGPEFPSVSSSTRPSALLRPFAHPGRGIARVRDSIVRLEHELQKKRLQTKAVGHVIEAPPTNASDSSPLSRYKTIGFSWHRGFKIGSGQFGKVYTAVNNSTGELLALKVQPISHTDRKLVAKMVEELRILEGFSHPNLVKYYGMEILEDELLFFMEYCEEGTLEHLSYSTEFGLPEEMVRRYTRQLLDGVAALHDCGVIHRDIKGANIFLTHESLNLKLGDFGCAVRLRGDRTEVGELAGIAGTHAFMAPEIFQCAGGYGRAADVWSLACVVIEMCTAKRPWPELNNSAQIMFKVGMGQSPACPPSLSKEGQDFLSKCFVHDPQERATASSLLHHPFVKVELDEDNYSLPLYSGTQQYYAYNTTFEHSS